MTSIAVVILTVVWSAVGVLALRARTKPSPSFLRLTLTVAAGVSGAVLSWVFWSLPQTQSSDLAQIWAGSRAILQHQNPYEVVGPGRAFEWSFPLLYPMTAVVMMIPLAAVPMRWVDPLFVGLGFGLFTWAVTSRRLLAPALLALVSFPALMTMQTSQWSLLLTGAALIPSAGWLLAAKPTIGLALFTAFPRRTPAVAGGLLFVLTVIIWPGWVADWRATFASAPHIVAPVMRFGGPLVLLALLKWKRADARLLLALACIPHTTVPYETIPLFLIPRTWLEAWGLWALALLAYFAQGMMGPYESQAAYWASGAQWIVLLQYLPCLGMVLSRPNEWSSEVEDAVKLSSGESRRHDCGTVLRSALPRARAT
jgi:hypothetical protein